MHKKADTIASENQPIIGVPAAREVPPPREATAAARPRRKLRVAIRIIVGCLLLIATIFLGILVAREVRTSQYQAKYLAGVARKLTFGMSPGPSSSIRFPKTGPYDERLGYTHIPTLTNKRIEEGYEIAAQTRFSPQMLRLTKGGIFPTYHEKTQAGLRIMDQDGQDIFSARYPERVYKTFDAIPYVIVKTLLFIENRELLDRRYPSRNPAVEWDRFAAAFLHMA